jgi:hypothetical protein
VRAVAGGVGEPEEHGPVLEGILGHEAGARRGGQQDLWGGWGWLFFVFFVFVVFLGGGHFQDIILLLYSSATHARSFWRSVLREGDCGAQREHDTLHEQRQQAAAPCRRRA